MPRLCKAGTCIPGVRPTHVVTPDDGAWLIWYCVKCGHMTRRKPLPGGGGGGGGEVLRPPIERVA